MKERAIQKNIVLLGYMGSGKSVIGKLLAECTGMPHIDLDTFIEEKEKMSISAIFSSKGELHFRKLEAHYLETLLKQNELIVLSVGGGTPCYGINLKHITKNSVSIYLKATVGTLFNRLKTETSERPIVAEIGEQNLAEFIAKHLFERRFYYDQANHTVETDSKNLNEVVDEVIALL